MRQVIRFKTGRCRGQGENGQSCIGNDLISKTGGYIIVGSRERQGSKTLLMGKRLSFISAFDLSLPQAICKMDLQLPEVKYATKLNPHAGPLQMTRLLSPVCRPQASSIPASPH